MLVPILAGLHAGFHHGFMLNVIILEYRSRSNVHGDLDELNPRPHMHKIFEIILDQMSYSFEVIKCHIHWRFQIPVCVLSPPPPPLFPGSPLFNVVLVKPTHCVYVAILPTLDRGRGEGEREEEGVVYME